MDFSIKQIFKILLLSNLTIAVLVHASEYRAGSLERVYVPTNCDLESSSRNEYLTSFYRQWNELMSHWLDDYGAECGLYSSFSEQYRVFVPHKVGSVWYICEKLATNDATLSVLHLIKGECSVE